MIDHVTLRTSNLEATKEFYLKALEPLGYKLLHDDAEFFGLGKDNRIDTWFTTNQTNGGPVHIAWKAASEEEVDAFHKAALEAGGKDNGVPGIRSEYHENYYGAFVIGPDDNNIEAVFGN